MPKAYGVKWAGERLDTPVLDAAANGRQWMERSMDGSLKTWSLPVIHGVTLGKCLTLSLPISTIRELEWMIPKSPSCCDTQILLESQG